MSWAKAGTSGLRNNPRTYIVNSDVRLKYKIRKIYRDHLGFGLSFGLEALVAQVWMLIQKGKGK